MATPEDAAFINRMGKEPAVRQFMGGPIDVPVEATRRRLAASAFDSLYVAEEHLARSPIGYAGFFENDHVEPDAGDILVALLPEYQSQGYGIELLELLRDQWLGLARGSCFATTDPGNEAAAGLLERCGFVFASAYTDNFGQTRHVYRYVTVHP